MIWNITVRYKFTRTHLFLKLYYFITWWTFFYECWCNGLLKGVPFTYQKELCVCVWGGGGRYRFTFNEIRNLPSVWGGWVSEWRLLQVTGAERWMMKGVRESIITATVLLSLHHFMSLTWSNKSLLDVKLNNVMLAWRDAMKHKIYR